MDISADFQVGRILGRAYIYCLNSKIHFYLQGPLFTIRTYKLLRKYNVGQWYP